MIIRPRPGERYRHFKSTPEKEKTYEIIGVANSRLRYKSFSDYRVLSARNCDNPAEEFNVLEQICNTGKIEKEVLWVNVPGNKIYVVYRQLYKGDEFDEGTIWIRGLKDFMSHKTIDGKKIKKFVRLS